MENQFKSPNYSHPNDGFIYNTILNHNNSSSHRKSIFFSPGKIRNVIRRLSNRKAPGPDKISNCALKHISNKAMLRQTGILSKKLKNSPSDHVTKQGKDPNIPTHHRPISLLNLLSKSLSTPQPPQPLHLPQTQS